MNLQKKINQVVSKKEYKKSYPLQSELDALPKKTITLPDKTTVEVPDESQLPDETVGNVILNCLGFYKPEDKKETIYVNIAMESIWENETGEIELKEKIKNFIIKVLYASVIHDEALDESKPKSKTAVGYYYSWVIGQVLKEMGQVEVEESKL